MAPRILLLTQYYHPEIGAPQTRLRATVRGLVARGFAVTVVAPEPHYPLGIVPATYSAWTPRRERLDGVTVYRLPVIPGSGRSVRGRLASQLSFAWVALASLSLAGRVDAALVESPPLTLGMDAMALRSAGIPFVFHVADPWPDFPIALGYLRSRPLRAAAFALEDLTYRSAFAVTTVSQRLVDHLSKKPGAAGKVHLVSNGADVASFQTQRSRAEARAQLGWDGRPTLVYVGTIGLAQGLSTLIDALGRTRAEISVRVYGDGVERAEVEHMAAGLRPGLIKFCGPVPATEVPEILAAADAALVMLRRGPLYDGSVPTKLVEALAAGRPVVLAADGEARSIVEDARAGWIAAPDDAVSLAEAIDRWAIDRDPESKGVSARRYAVSHLDRAQSVATLAGLLSAAARSGHR